MNEDQSKRGSDADLPRSSVRWTGPRSAKKRAPSRSSRPRWPRADRIRVSPNPVKPRRAFAEADLADLSQSIRNTESCNPCVRQKVDGKYEIIAGERRWRAAQRARVLRKSRSWFATSTTGPRWNPAIIENVQRADLNPVEEALGYQQLIDEHNYTQADLGNVIGKSRSHVANTLRLLKLPDLIRGLLVDGLRQPDTRAPR